MSLKILFNAFLFIIIISSKIAFCQSQKSLLELCNESDDIVVAEIIDIESSYNESVGRIISTISLKIDEHIKSSWLRNNREFTMIYPGGVYGDIIQIIPDAPCFSQSEETILFLKKRFTSDKAFIYVYGLSQGKFNIVKDNKNNKYVLRDSGLDYLLISPSLQHDVIQLHSTTKISKTDFISMIKSLL